MTPRNTPKKDKRPSPQPAEDYWQTKARLDRKEIKLFTQTIYRDWCKACGICIAFCPKKVFSRGKDGKPEIARPDACIGCRFCELHCPDFALSIHLRYPDRRTKPDGK